MDRVKGLAIAGWTLAGVLLLTAAGDKHEIRARSFVVEDEKGQPSIILKHDFNGPSISMLDDNGKQKLEMSMSGNWPTIELRGMGENRALSLTVDEEGYPFIWVENPQNGAKLLMYGQKDGSIVLKVKNDDDHQVEIKAPHKGEPKITVKNGGKVDVISKP